MKKGFMRPLAACVVAAAMLLASLAPFAVTVRAEEDGIIIPDLGGRVIRIATQERGGFGFMGPLHPTDDEFIDADPEDANYHRLQLQIANRIRVEEMFNIVIDPVHIPGGQFINRYREAALAGELLADIVENSQAQQFTAANSGYILPLDVLAAQAYEQFGVRLNFVNEQTTAWPWLEIFGHIWSVGRPLPVASPPAGIVVNLDLIEAFGAPCPVEAYDRGEWNWDTFREIMVATTQDTTGDGNIDHWGLTGDLGSLIGHLIVGNDGFMLHDDTLLLGYTDPEAMEALEFLYEIMNNWWTTSDPDHANPARGGTNAQFFGEGRSAMGIGWPSMIRDMPINQGLTTNLTFMSMPMGPNNTSGFTTTGMLRNAVMVLDGAEDPEILAWIIDELFAWPGEDWYELEYTFDRDGWAASFMPDQASLDRLFDIGLRQMRLDLGQLIGVVGAYHNNMIDAWFLGEMTVAQAVEFWRQERQDFVDNFFGLIEPREVVVPDLGGRVIRIGTQERGAFGFLGPLHATENEFIDANPEDGNYHRLQLQIANRLRVEEMFNIIIEPIHVPGGQFINRYREAALAGELLADIVENSQAQQFTAAHSGYIHALDVLAANLYETNAALLSFMTDRHHTWPWLEFFGNVWSIGRPLPVGSPFGIVVNLDLIEAFGAPCPIEAYEAGEWNWDTFREIMVATTQDTTGDGNIDHWGLTGDLGTLIGSLIIGNDGFFLHEETLLLGYTDPEVMEALEFLYEIMNNWWTTSDPEHANPARGGTNANFFGEGRSAMGIGWPSMIRDMPVNQGLTTNLTFMSFPMGPNNTSGFTTSGGLRNAVMVLEGAEDPEYLLWIIDELFKWSGDDWYELEYTFDRDSWAAAFMPDEASLHRLFDIGLNQSRLDLGSLIGVVGAYHNNMIDAWFLGEMTVAQAVEFWRQERQDFVNEFFGLVDDEYEEVEEEVEEE
ncbi:MAG: ABC transporter substrate-binding protein [Defluviitaleaceae bacterium]|nr:ABC transporter substrate-binding protein [Defluviitaleaceae bacterium]